MLRDERWLEEQEERYERVRASSTCADCAFSVAAEPDHGFMRRQAERFMRLVEPAPDVSRTRESLTAELAAMLRNEVANVCLCTAFDALLTGDCPAEDCPDFEPADTGWSE